MRFASIISLLALFLSLGGVSYAVTQIPDNSVSGRHVVNGSLTGTDVRNGTITSSDIKDGSITGADVLGALPGITYFKYRGKEVSLTPRWTVLITDQVAKGVYSVTGQVVVKAQEGSHIDVVCHINYKGTTDAAPRAAYGFESRALSNNPSFPSATGVSIDLSGVYEATADDTVVALRCFGYGTSGAPVVGNARLQSIELRDLQIEEQT